MFYYRIVKFFCKSVKFHQRTAKFYYSNIKSYYRTVDIFYKIVKFHDVFPVAVSYCKIFFATTLRNMKAFYKIAIVTKTFNGSENY